MRTMHVLISLTLIAAGLFALYFAAIWSFMAIHNANKGFGFEHADVDVLLSAGVAWVYSGSDARD